MPDSDHLEECHDNGPMEFIIVRLMAFVFLLVHSVHQARDWTEQIDSGLARSWSAAAEGIA